MKTRLLEWPKRIELASSARRAVRRVVQPDASWREIPAERLVERPTLH
jgi:hypothetical protein